MCEPCREDRRARRSATRHAERRAAGLCVHCAAPAPGGKTYCEPVRQAPAPRRRNLEAKREADRRRYAETEGPGRLHELRQAGQRRGRVPGLLQRRPRPLRRPPGRRGLRQVPDAHLWRHGLLCALRRRQGRAPRPRGGIRRPARPVRRNAGPGAVASSARRRRRGWRAASRVRASTAKAPERFEASRSGTRAGR